jgi:hypothetical protein
MKNFRLIQLEILMMKFRKSLMSRHYQVQKKLDLVVVLKLKVQPRPILELGSARMLLLKVLLEMLLQVVRGIACLNKRSWSLLIR